MDSYDDIPVDDELLNQLLAPSTNESSSSSASASLSSSSSSSSVAKSKNTKFGLPTSNNDKKNNGNKKRSRSMGKNKQTFASIAKKIKLDIVDSDGSKGANIDLELDANDDDENEAKDLAMSIVRFDTCSEVQYIVDILKSSASECTFTVVDETMDKNATFDADPWTTAIDQQNMLNKSGLRIACANSVNTIFYWGYIHGKVSKIVKLSPIDEKNIKNSQQRDIELNNLRSFHVNLKQLHSILKNIDSGTPVCFVVNQDKLVIYPATLVKKDEGPVYVIDKNTRYDLSLLDAGSEWSSENNRNMALSMAKFTVYMELYAKDFINSINTASKLDASIIELSVIKTECKTAKSMFNKKDENSGQDGFWYTFCYETNNQTGANMKRLAPSVYISQEQFKKAVESELLILKVPSEDDRKTEQVKCLDNKYIKQKDKIWKMQFNVKNIESIAGRVSNQPIFLKIYPDHNYLKIRIKKGDNSYLETCLVATSRQDE